MAEHDDTQNSNEKKTESNAAPASDLPTVEAPSVSPAKLDEEPVVEAASPVAPSSEPFNPVIRRLFGPAGLAAATIIAAVLGGAVTAYFSAPRVETAAVAERHTMQIAIARLSREVGTLKSELASASKSARAQTAQLTKLNETLTDKLARESAAVTGSIFAPQTAAPKAEAQPASTAQPAPVQTAAPLPQPRPAAEIAASNEPAVVQGWSVVGARRGLVYVRSGRDIFGVAPGARLPGVGLVEEVRRQDGEWIVVTRRGLILAERERRSYDRY